MKKPAAVMLAVGALVLGLALGSVGIVQAQTDEEPARRFGGFVDAVAELIGISTDEFVEQRQGGESLPKIAEDAGVSADELVDAMYEERLAQIEDLFEEGLISEAQLDWARKNLRASIEERVMSDGTLGRGFGPGQHMGGRRGPGAGPGSGVGGQGGCWDPQPAGEPEA